MKLTITTIRTGIFLSCLLGAFGVKAQFTFPGAPVPFTPTPAPSSSISVTTETEKASSCFQNDGSIVITATGGVVGEMGMGIVGNDCAEGTTQPMTQVASNVFALKLINPEAYCSRPFVQGDIFTYKIDVYNPDTDQWSEIFSATTGTDCYYFPERIEFPEQSAVSAIRFRANPDTNCGMQVQGMSFMFEAYGYQYSIDNGATWSQSNRFVGLSPGMYQVKVQDGVGDMSLTQVVNVDQSAETAVEAGEDLYIVEGNSAQLNATVNNLGEVFLGSSADPEEICIFDAEGGAGSECAALGSSICAEGYVWQYNDATQSGSVTSPDLVSVENLQLSIYYSCGDYSQPDGFNKWDLYVNGVLVGTTGETSSAGCTCEAAQFGTFPKEFNFDDYATINSVWEPGQENNIEIIYSSRYNTGIALSAYKLLVTYGGVQTYEWEPAESLSASNIANPMASPTQTTEYTINYTDKYGCTASDNVTVNVIPGGPGPGPGPGPSPMPTPDLITVKTNDVTVYLGADGTAQVTPDMVDDGSTAVAGIETRSLSISDFDCQMVGDNAIDLIIEDKLGRTESEALVVTVVDDEAPILTLVGDETIVHERYTDFSDPGVTSADNCSATVTVVGTVDNTTPGTYTITYTAEDPTGNSTTLSRDVVVEDDEDDDNDGIPDTIDQYVLDADNNNQPVLVSFVWDDLDGDGIQDQDEPGIEGVAVSLLTGGSQELATSFTSDEGLVAFFDLALETNYRLEFTAPSGYGATMKDAGTDDGKDSDTGKKTKKFKLVDGITDHWDIGFTSPGEILSFVWDDRNGDGLQDEDEPGLKDITLHLLNAQGEKIKQARTNNNGFASLGDVPADEKFQVQFFLPNGHAFTRVNRGSNDSKDSDAKRGTGITRKYKATSGRSRYQAIDAGMWTPGKVEAYLWDDRNGDGVQDDDEPGIKDVIVHLLDEDGNHLRQGRTNNNGIATITKVPADQRVRLQFNDKNNYGITFRNRGDADLNSDIHRKTLQTRKFRLRKGSETVDRFDAGFWSPGTIETFLWDDRNGDGVQDAGEPGVKDVIVHVYDKDGNHVKQGRTNNNGIATIQGIPADKPVRLQFTDRDGYRFTLRAKGDDTELDSDINRGRGHHKKNQSRSRSTTIHLF